ncbi:hypothetical protein C1645_839576 [Glomus cerebriforme]|uniref:Uncharacterized protein n=1 Tax=Glomus cerebriforme TaxID=658196 RepID=A0A397S1W0_9GLOM|nr:hypothetical protein C1645_839576 [Glomus cerebriforme]
MLRKHFPEVFPLFKKKTIQSYITPELEKYFTEERRKWENFAEKVAYNIKSKNPVKISEVLESTPKSLPKFKEFDIRPLRVSFQPALFKDNVIPPVEVTDFPKEYILPKINTGMLTKQNLDIEELYYISNNDVKKFINLLHDTVQNRLMARKTNEIHNNILVNNLLHIINLDTWPFNIKINPPCKLIVYDKPYALACPELVINNNQHMAIIVMNKYLQSDVKNFEEMQIAAEILTYGDENRRKACEISDQTIFAVRIIFTHVTFYKAVISAAYWKEIDNGLPRKQSVLIKRWPRKNGLQTGLDIAEPNGREEVLLSLAKIRKFLLQNNSNTG